MLCINSVLRIATNERRGTSWIRSGRVSSEKRKEGILVYECYEINTRLKKDAIRKVWLKRFLDCISIKVVTCRFMRGIRRPALIYLFTKQNVQTLKLYEIRIWLRLNFNYFEICKYSQYLIEIS